MAFTLTQLAAEINTDPTALGLVALKAAGSDQAIADVLNLSRVGITVDRNDIRAKELQGAVVTAEYLALAQPQRDLWQALLTIAPLDAGDANTKASVAAVFSAGPTRTALVALATRQGSRAEQLWGTGTTVSAISVSRALGRPGVQ